MLKSLSILQIAGIIGGALVLNKVLKAKVGIVAKNENTGVVSPVLSIVPPTVQSVFETIKNVLDVPTNIETELRTPFNSDIKDKLEMAANFVSMTPNTNDYFN